MAEAISKELTYKISQEPISPYPLVINNVVRISDTVISIPAGRADLIPEDYEVKDKRISSPIDLPNPGFVPRDSQRGAIDWFQGQGIINAPVGWGKSIAGLGIINKVKEKTLIITTTTTIRDMWVKEIKKWFGIEPGIVGGGKFNIEPPIVVGNIQTVRNRLDKLSNEFGMVLVDEVHRTPAATFTKALDSLRPKYRLGLSGTLKRKDGMHVVLTDYFGGERYVGKVENTIEPEVHLYDTGYEMTSNEFIPWANKVTALMSSPTYWNQVFMLANMYCEAGHKVLVLCDRVAFLESLHLEMPDKSLLITGKINSTEEREQIMKAIAEHSSGIVLYAIQSIFSEGISLNELSVVILGTPISNNAPLLEQIVGRVMRLADNKNTAIVADLGLTGSTGKRQRNKRLQTYVKRGWKIVDKGRI